jgi:hypothetical protein
MPLTVLLVLAVIVLAVALLFTAKLKGPRPDRTQGIRAHILSVCIAAVKDGSNQYDLACGNVSLIDPNSSG